MSLVQRFHCISSVSLPPYPRNEAGDLEANPGHLGAKERRHSPTQSERHYWSVRSEPCDLLNHASLGLQDAAGHGKQDSQGLHAGQTRLTGFENWNQFSLLQEASSSSDDEPSSPTHKRPASQASRHRTNIPSSPSSKVYYAVNKGL